MSFLFSISIFIKIKSFLSTIYLSGAKLARAAAISSLLEKRKGSKDVATEQIYEPKRLVLQSVSHMRVLFGMDDSMGADKI